MERFERADWRELSRRAFVATLASGAVLLRAQDTAPSCTLTAEQEEGPFYIDGAVLRRDVTEAKKGLPLTLRVLFLDSRRCVPLTNAAVDIWHCDAAGTYSGFTADAMTQPPGPPPGRRPDGPNPDGLGFMPLPFPDGRGGRGGRGRSVDSTRFLRGVQITNEKGLVEFATIYPGWYAGRTIHVHMKVHVGGSRASDTYAGGHVSHTGQLFFPEDVTESVARTAPYSAHSGLYRTPQAEDGVFRDQHGSGSIVRIEKDSATGGFVAIASVAVNPDLTPSMIMPGRGGRGPRG